jgi:hypothetical protein
MYSNCIWTALLFSLTEMCGQIGHFSNISET